MAAESLIEFLVNPGLNWPKRKVAGIAQRSNKLVAAAETIDFLRPRLGFPSPKIIEERLSTWLSLLMGATNIQSEPMGDEDTFRLSLTSLFVTEIKLVGGRLNELIEHEFVSSTHTEEDPQSVKTTQVLEYNASQHPTHIEIALPRHKTVRFEQTRLLKGGDDVLVRTDTVDSGKIALQIAFLAAELGQNPMAYSIFTNAGAESENFEILFDQRLQWVPRNAYTIKDQVSATY